MGLFDIWREEMTREEAAHIVDVAFGVPQAVRRVGEDRTYHEGEIKEAKDMAIKALEQEPCEDCISRQAVLDIDFKKIILTTAKPAEMIEQKVKALPSVNPQPKTGHWILRNDINGEYQCDECGMFSGLSKFDVEEARRKLSNFCPNCGAKMVEIQKREEQE